MCIALSDVDFQLFLLSPVFAIVSCVLPARGDGREAHGGIEACHDVQAVEQNWAEEMGPYLPQEMV